MKLRHKIRLAALLCLGSTTAWASERVLLTNGFEMRCDHHSRTSAGLRLFLDKSEESFLDLALDRIASIEFVPDPPSVVKAPEPSKAAKIPEKEHLTETDLKEMLVVAGEAQNLDEDLLASVVKAESGGNTRAVSRTGARGLMQLMPGTAAGLGVKDSFQPDENLRGGSQYLDKLLRRYHDNIALALAAYNAGPEAVDRYHGIPPYAETRAYVAHVIHEFNRRVRARELAARTAATGHR